MYNTIKAVCSGSRLSMYAAAADMEANSNKGRFKKIPFKVGKPCVKLFWLRRRSLTSPNVFCLSINLKF